MSPFNRSAGRAGALVVGLLSAGCGAASPPAAPEAIAAPAAPDAEVSCFILREMGVGETRRAPSSGCAARFVPASTFKIPHALAALDAGVIAGAETTLPYSGAAYPFPSWQREHTLASAMQNSVVWYFVRIAERLGPEGEQTYLARLHYGNADPGTGNEATPFWLGGPLSISPDEQAAFLVRLYEGALPVTEHAMQTVRDILVQPSGSIVNAMGQRPFAAPWPARTTLSAKTGSAGEARGHAVRWLVGHVQRDGRAWVFVSCVAGGDTLAPTAAIDLAARALHEESVL